MTTRTQHIARVLAPVAVLGMMALAGCSSAADSGSEAELGSEQRPVKLGVVGASDPYWDVYEKAVEAEGIHLDIEDFTEYTQPKQPPWPTVRGGVSVRGRTYFGTSSCRDRSTI